MESKNKEKQQNEKTRNIRSKPLMIQASSHDDDYVDDDDGDVSGAKFAAFQDLLRSWAMGQQAKGGGTATTDRLMELIGQEEQHQQASRRGGRGGMMGAVEDDESAEDDSEDDH